MIVLPVGSRIVCPRGASARLVPRLSPLPATLAFFQKPTRIPRA